MSIERKADRILEQARARAERVASWADFSNAIFGPGGLVAKAFPTDIERQAFYDSRQYKDVQAILLCLMKKFGLAAGAAPKEKSGRFVVRVPKTIHHTLDIEAKREGVSLNQLAVTKLSLPLPTATGIAESAIIEAFNSTHDGYATDWVIIEPHHNRLFLDRCLSLGLMHDEYLLNHKLMNVRKTKKYADRLNKATKKSGFSSYDDCAYAAEIAIRTLQRSDGVTLDRTLCDPRLLARFDAIAASLVLGQLQLKLRCAALNLRKTHRLQPMDLSGEQYELVTTGPVRKVSLSGIAEMPGVYAFYDHTRPIYAGETENLKKRIAAHLEAGLPNWLGARDDEGFILKSLVLPSGKKEHRLNWLGAFVNRERPLLNYQQAA